MQGWEDVQAAVAVMKSTYEVLLEVRGEKRSDSKLVRQAESEFDQAHEARKQALLAHWDEAEDGVMEDGKPRLANVLVRYYDSYITQKNAHEKAEVKRKRAKAAKKREKEVSA
jgi:hypothetical protein